MPDGDNTINQDAMVQTLNRELAPLEEEMEALREKKKKLRQQFKADSGMSLADFDAGRRLAMIEDDDARAEKCSNMTRVFNALSQGEQLDWVTADAAE